MISASLTLIASYLALFFAICKIAGKNKNISDYYLIIWLLTLSAFMFCKLGNILFFAFSKELLSVLYGIILFLYFKNITPGSKFQPKDLLHFIPFAIIALPLFFVGGYINTMLFQILKLLIFVTYITLSILMVLNHKHSLKEAYSNAEYTNMPWLYMLICGSLFFVVSLIIKLIFPGYTIELAESIILFVFLNIIGLKGGFQYVKFIEQSLNFYNNHDRKITYSNYGLKDEDAKKLSEKLCIYMMKEKPYLNQSLSLKDLAKAIDTYPHYITQVLNTIFNKNFYDFVNQYRIEEAERQLKSSSKAKFTILSIAYDCGFNSKATFNRVFKDKKGITPTEYKLSLN